MEQKQAPAQEAHPLILRLRYLLLSVDFDFSEAITSWAGFFGGLMLLAPAKTFAISTAYTAMRDVAPEWGWGTLLFMLGGAQATALVLNSYRWRSWLAFAMCGLWTFITATFWMSAFFSFGSVLFPSLALSAAWAFWRLRMMGAHSE